jgi:hypothetical protein
LISNLNFKIQVEFEKVFNMKLVELEILKISYLGNFSSCYMFLEVILENNLKNKNLGGCYSLRRIVAGQRATWAPTSRRGLRPSSRHAAVASCRSCGALLLLDHHYKAQPSSRRAAIASCRPRGALLLLDHHYKA